MIQSYYPLLKFLQILQQPLKLIENYIQGHDDTPLALLFNFPPTSKKQRKNKSAQNGNQLNKRVWNISLLKKSIKKNYNNK